MQGKHSTFFMLLKNASFCQIFERVVYSKDRIEKQEKKKVKVGKNVLTVIQSKLRTKCNDPGMFSIPCMIDDTRFDKAMLDLGASINVMPYSTYTSLELGPLKKTGVVIRLADRSNKYSKGLVEDVLMQVNDLIFSADFYVLDMGNSYENTPILLVRPFLKRSKTKIDVHSGTISMEFDEKTINFNIDDDMSYSTDGNHVILLM